MGSPDVLCPLAGILSVAFPRSSLLDNSTGYIKSLMIIWVESKFLIDQCIVFENKYYLCIALER